MNSQLQYYSTLTEKKAAANYLIGRIPKDMGGTKFEQQNLLLAPLVSSFAGRLLARPVLSYLQRKGYDALIYKQKNIFLGYTAFQCHHDRSLHIFSIYVDSTHRNKGIATQMLEDIICYSKIHNYYTIRLGGGNNAATNKLHANLRSRQSELGILVYPSNWLELL